MPSTAIREGLNLTDSLYMASSRPAISYPVVMRVPCPDSFPVLVRASADAYLPWDAWLRAEAGKGNAGALACLEARKDCGTVQGEIFGLARDEARPTPQKTTRHGTFLYAEGREHKRRILVDPQASDDELEKSLRLARERFGSRLFVSGPPGFGVRLARCAAERKVPVAFFDKELEAHREGVLRGEQHSARRSKGR